MKIDMAAGQPTIDAKDLGQLLDLAPDDVQSLMRAGQITTRFETGQGEDEGRMRLTFFHEGRRVRLTCAMDGTVLSTSRIPVGGT